MLVSALKSSLDYANRHPPWLVADKIGFLLQRLKEVAHREISKVSRLYNFASLNLAKRASHFSIFGLIDVKDIPSLILWLEERQFSPSSGVCVYVCVFFFFFSVLFLVLVE